MKIDFSSVISTFIGCENDIPSDYESISNRIFEAINEFKTCLNHGEFVEINLGVIGSIVYPFYKYKNLTSLDLLSPEDIFLFSRYVINYPTINRFIDIGANIGLHSLVAKKIGYSVISFEPDLDTLGDAKEFFEANNVEFHELKEDEISFEKFKYKPDDFLLVQAAVSDFNGFTKFTKILDNPTANHLSGRKSNIYGETIEHNVQVICIDRVDFEAVIKMDAEGEDARILRSVLNSEIRSGFLYLCDWRGETRQDIFKLLSKNQRHAYNPFLKKTVENINDLPMNKSSDFIQVEI